MYKTLPFLNKIRRSLFIISSCFIFINQLCAQDYQSIRSNQINYYGTQNLDYILATRTDSIQLSGIDSVFYSFKSARYDSLPNVPQGVHSQAGDSWYGRMTTIDANGRNTFVNRYGESIVVETQASLGETFPMYAYPNGNDTIFGTISLHDTMTVLGALDSIKLITLYSSEPSFLLNNDTLILSKDHGFVRVFPFYSFPNAYPKADYDYIINLISEPLNLVGMDYPRVGVTKLTGAEMHTMDVNDQVGIRQMHTCSPIFSGAHSYTLRTTTSRTNVNNTAQFNFDYNNNPQSSNCWTQTHLSSLFVDNLDQYPDQFLPEELYLENPTDSTGLAFQTLNNSEHCGKQLVSKKLGRGYTWHSDNTIEMSIEPSVLIENELEGFGFVYLTGSSFTGGSMMYTNYSGFVYYQLLGAETCGDPTLAISEQEGTELVVKPNPVVNGKFSILSDFSNQSCELIIYDLSGKIQKNAHLYSLNDIDVIDLSKGVYIVKLIFEDRYLTERIVIQ